MIINKTTLNSICQHNNGEKNIKREIFYLLKSDKPRMESWCIMGEYTKCTTLLYLNEKTTERFVRNIVRLGRNSYNEKFVAFPGVLFFMSKIFIFFVLHFSLILPTEFRTISIIAEISIIWITSNGSNMEKAYRTMFEMMFNGKINA